MAKYVVKGIQATGRNAKIITADSLGSADISKHDTTAFECLAMGDKILEENTFKPMLTAVDGSLSGMRVGLFESYN